MRRKGTLLDSVSRSDAAMVCESQFSHDRRTQTGSVGVYFGPTAPKGLEKNWVPTLPGKG
jgi:hypothetical protein